MPKTCFPQFLQERSVDWNQVRDGLRQALWGMAKKVLIADNLASTVEAAYEGYETAGGGALFLASCLFLVQLYCDFSGYSDIAIGTAKVLGFKLTRNFNNPLFSRSFTEFWQRWHITLSTFLRDYLFLEIEMRIRRRHLNRRRQLPKDQRGSRTPPAWKTGANMMFVFAVSGLWHGATWAFVVWGFLNGVYLVYELLQRKTVDQNVVAHDRKWPTRTEFRQILFVNFVVVLTVVLFRADGLAHATSIYVSMLTSPLAGIRPIANFFPVMLAAIPLIVEYRQRREEHALAQLDAWPRIVRWPLYYALIFAIIVCGDANSRTFVYFQF